MVDYRELLEKKGYLVLDTEEDATEMSKQLEPEIRAGIVVGIRSRPDKKFYITYRGMLTRLQDKILKVMGEEQVTVQRIAYNARLPEEEVAAIMPILAETTESNIEYIGDSMYKYVPPEKRAISSDQTAEYRKQLELPKEGRPISEFADQIGECFNGAAELFYRPVDRTVVKLEMTVVTEDDNKIPLFHPVGADEFITLVEWHFDTGIRRNNGSENEIIFRKKSMPKSVAQTVLASEYQFKRQLPIIERIFTIPMPFLRDDQLVFPKIGYDPDLQSWLHATAPMINLDMKLEEAIELIRGIYSEFCFKSEQDRTNTIAHLLTQFCRGLYRNKRARTPAFFYLANRERAGKDYCAGITGIIYEGCAVEDSPIASDGETHDDEIRKKILSTFKSGRNRIHFSNNKGYLNSSTLESLITAEEWSDRQLGSNVLLTFSNTLEISLSANTGITYTPDFGARSIFINLFFSEEDPNQRVFKMPDLHMWVTEHRSEIISAMYALVKNWKDKGMPAGSRPFTSYPEWARVVGGIMEAAGLGNPCVPNSAGNEIGGDKETRDMKRLFELCYQFKGEQWVEKKDVVKEIMDTDSPFFGLFDYLKWFDKDGGQAARVKFGVVLSKFKGRELSGVKLDWADATKGHAERDKFKWTKGKVSQATLVGLGALGGSLPMVKNNETENVGALGALGGSYNPLYVRERIKGSIEKPSKPTRPPNSETILASNSQQNNGHETRESRDCAVRILEHLHRAGGRDSLENIATGLARPQDEVISILKDLERSGEVFSPRTGSWKLVAAENNDHELIQ